MSKVCDITGKKAMVGNRVSHSNVKTKRRFLPNLFKKKFFVPSTGEWVVLKVSGTGLRTINKNGIEAAMKTAKTKGFL